MYETRRFLIIPTSIINSINFDEVYETSTQTLRFSVDGQKTFVKYDLPNRPSIYSTDYEELDYDEIVQLLNTDEWMSGEEMGGE